MSQLPQRASYPSRKLSKPQATKKKQSQQETIEHKNNQTSLDIAKQAIQQNKHSTT
jgi:hypothetical protein